MKVTIIKNSRKKEVVNRVGLDELARMIKDGDVAEDVRYVRELYHLMRPVRLETG